MFTERRFGEEAVAACTQALSPADQTILRTTLPMGWYPLEPTIRYMRVLDATYGTGDLELCREIGRFSAGPARLRVT